MAISKYYDIIDENERYQKRSLYKYQLFILEVQISEDRKKRVIDLYFNQHKTYAEIAQIERISPRDIHAIIKEEQSRRQKHKDRQQQEEISSKALQLFSEDKRPLQVAVALNLREPELTKIYREYWKLKRLDALNSIYEETNDKLLFWSRYIKTIRRKASKSMFCL
jgi:hypothetical protein